MVPCRTGWMTALEDEVQPLLMAMIQGHSVSLLARAQSAMAAWAAMKAAVSEYIWTGDPVLTAEHRGYYGRALCLTIAAGSLVIQVFGGSDIGQRALRLNDGLEAEWITIWPGTGTVQWPPPDAGADRSSDPHCGNGLAPSPARMFGSQ